MNAEYSRLSVVGPAAVFVMDGARRLPDRLHLSVESHRRGSERAARFPHKQTAEPITEDS